MEEDSVEARREATVEEQAERVQLQEVHQNAPEARNMIRDEEEKREQLEKTNQIEFMSPISNRILQIYKK